MITDQDLNSTIRNEANAVWAGFMRAQLVKSVRTYLDKPGITELFLSVMRDSEIPRVEKLEVFVSEIDNQSAKRINPFVGHTLFHTLRKLNGF